jgi:hypothetical protein
MEYDRNAEIFDVASDIADNAPDDPKSRWLWGVVAAGALAAYGVRCLILQRAIAPRSRPIGVRELIGGDAMALGCLCLCVAAFMHAHWFWSGHPRWHGYGQLGKLVTMIGVVASVAWFLYEGWWVN